MDDGFEVNHEYINRVMKDQILVKGASLFEKEVFHNIKENLLPGAKTKTVDTLEGPIEYKKPQRMGIDVNKELKNFSSIEMDHIKDQAINDEKRRL